MKNVHEIKDYLLRNYPHISFKQKWQIDNYISYMIGSCSSIIKAISLLPLTPKLREEFKTVSLIT